MRKFFILLVILCTSYISNAQTSLLNYSTTVVSADHGVRLINSPTIYHQLTWRGQGTLSTCTVALDSSVDGSTWTAGGVITGQTCTSAGSSTIVNAVVNYVRINVTAISGGGTVFINYSGYSTNPGGGGSGTVTQVNTNSPLGGGPITTTGSVTCATCVVASSPGAGLAHFAGSTQTVTSSAVSLTADVSGILPVLNGGSGSSSPGLIAGSNVTITGTWPNQTINSSATGSTAWSAITHGTNTDTGAFSTAGSWTYSAAGAASTPSITQSGNVFTGGTGTTTFPLWYINNGASAPTGWSTSGAYFGINALSGFTGNFFDFWLNGVHEVNLGRTGTMNTNGGMQNLTNGSNSSLLVSTTGPQAVTAIAGNVAMTVNNSNASPTANLQNWQANSVTQSFITNTGAFSGPVASASTATTQSSGDNSTKLATTAYVDRIPKTHALGYAFGDAVTGSALTTSEVGYITVPFACTITGWHIMLDAGTATIKTWRVNGGTALPTVSNSINTSGVAISTGTKIDSTTTSDFTSTAIAANDTLGFSLSAVATAKQLTFQLDCATI